MLIETFPVGPFQCNCTILADDATREAIIIDPGDEPEQILDIVRVNDLTVRYLIHTHAHMDHMIGTRRVKEETGAAILLHRDDDWLYRNLEMQASMFGIQVQAPLAIDAYLEDGQLVSFGVGGEARVIHTPGHSPGSVCFRLRDEQEMLFSGDTLFAQGIGRTDLWGGSFETLVRSIHDRLLTMDDETLLHPGHGPSSTVWQEKRRNPWLQ